MEQLLLWLYPWSPLNLMNFLWKFVSYNLTKFFKGDWHLHGLRVDECEEEDICSLLLVWIEKRLPTVTISIIA